MAALRSTVTKWTPGIGAMDPVVMPMPFSNQCCGNQIHWIWVPIQGYTINFVFGYGSEFGSRMLLNTDPKRIRIHNTVSNWLRASAFYPAFIWACMFQAHHHAKFNLSFKAHLLPPPTLIVDVIKLYVSWGETSVPPIWRPSFWVLVHIQQMAF